MTTTVTTSITPGGDAATTTPRSAARWAGLGYLAIFVLAVFANFFVVGTVYDPEDPVATLDGVASSSDLLRWGILAFLAVFVIDIVVAWALYVLFRPVRRDLSLLAAWSRLVYTVFLGVGLVFAHAAIVISDGDSPAAARADDVQLAMQSFEMTWLIGLAAFGVHLMLLGRLLIGSTTAPRWLAVVLMVAGAAYVIDTAAHILLADYAGVADLLLLMVAIPSVIGELGFTVWLLLISGGRISPPAAKVLSAPASVEAG